MMYTTVVILYKNKGIQMGARFSTPVLYKGYRVSLPGAKRLGGMALTTHPHLVPRLKKEYSYT